MPKNMNRDGTENLTDDEAIVRLFQSLKKPPGLLERLKACDKDGDGYLTRDEFI